MKIFIAALLMTLSIPQGFAFEVPARTLGKVSIGPDAKYYSMKVKKCASDFSHIKLTVQKNGVVAHSVGFGYSDGTKDEYSFSQTFESGYQSDWMDLDAIRKKDHCITSIFVNAESLDKHSAPAQLTILRN